MEQVTGRSVTHTKDSNVKINTTQMSTSKHYLVRACYIKAVSQYHLHLVDSKACRGVGKLYNGKMEGLRYAQIGGCWHGE